MNSFIENNLSILDGLPLKWLDIQRKTGLTPNTIDAYSRALVDYLSFCQENHISHTDVAREHVANYINDLNYRPVRHKKRIGLASSTKRLYISAIHSYYEYLKEEEIKIFNPVRHSGHTNGRGRTYGNRSLIPHYEKLPWIPKDEQWRSIIIAAKDEPIRNQLMLALAYDSALRREELCNLKMDDIDPSYRMLTLHAENTKTRRGRAVQYSEDASLLLKSYQHKRRELNRGCDYLFLSESRRNKAQPISFWTWSKVVQELGRRAGVPQLTTHTFRHLRLTDLARAGIEINLIAQFAGHTDIKTTMKYIHLSGRELADKLSKSMDDIHKWRVQMMSNTFLK